MSDLNRSLLAQYLQQYAELNRFWVLRSESIQPGLIHYLGSDGTAYVLMDDDDTRVEHCVKLLEANGNPFFSEVSEMDEHAAQLGMESVTG